MMTPLPALTVALILLAGFLPLAQIRAAMSAPGSSSRLPLIPRQRFTKTNYTFTEGSLSVALHDTTDPAVQAQRICDDAILSHGETSRAAFDLKCQTFMVSWVHAVRRYLIVKVFESEISAGLESKGYTLGVDVWEGHIGTYDEKIRVLCRFCDARTNHCTYVCCAIARLCVRVSLVVHKYLQCSVTCGIPPQSRPLFKTRAHASDGNKLAYSPIDYSNRRNDIRKKWRSYLDTCCQTHWSTRQQMFSLNRKPSLQLRPPPHTLIHSYKRRNTQLLTLLTTPSPSLLLTHMRCRNLALLLCTTYASFLLCRQPRDGSPGGNGLRNWVQRRPFGRDCDACQPPCRRYLI